MREWQWVEESVRVGELGGGSEWKSRCMRESVSGWKREGVE